MEAACQMVNDISLKIKVDFYELDLACQASVEQCVAAIMKDHDRFDVVLGNAGVCLDGYLADGIEKCMGINHFGHFAFILRLLNALGKPNWPQRLVMTSSFAAPLLGSDGLNFDDLNIQNKSNKYHRNRLIHCYAQSKLANLLFTRSLAEKAPEMLCHAIHPGCVVSEIQRANMSSAAWPVANFFNRLVLRSPKAGAQCTLHAAFSTRTSVTSKNGQFFDNC